MFPRLRVLPAVAVLVVALLNPGAAASFDVAAPYWEDLPPAGPLEVQFEAQPAELPQGGVSVIVARANQPIASAEGTLGGSPLVFDWSSGIAWAYAGFESTARLGSREVSVTIRSLTGEQQSSTLGLTITPGNFPVEELWVPAGQAGLLAPAVLNREWIQLVSLTSQVADQRFWQPPFLVPVDGPVSDPYGTLRSYNGGPGGDPHQGMDIAAPTGTPIYASNSGYAYVRDWPVRGNTVLMDHGLGVWSGYYHMSAVAIENGQFVNRGDLLGWVGATGLATGPHLHWDMMLQGIHTSPLAWTRITVPGS
jgi:murein DD-endopeptidase MepM/ murein hydrolase activator NlpD